MRARGTLRKADVEYQTKHPIILHSQNWAVKLFLDEMHETRDQECAEYLRSVVQQKFWFLSLRNALRSVKHEWVQCKNLARAMTPQMSASRLEGLVHPLGYCGVDYRGSFQVKQFRKTVKWIFLFTCFSSRVVHLEIVSSLDTQCFLDAIHRFLTRRGSTKTIISDNGTSSVGAAREFRQLFSAFSGTQLEEYAAQLGINWTLNPPGAPRFGGVWERLVRSCKKAMWFFLVLNR